MQLFVHIAGIRIWIVGKRLIMEMKEQKNLNVDHVEQVLKIALDLNQPEKFLQAVTPTLTVVEGSRMEVAN